MDTLIVLSLLLILAYVYFTRSFSYWKKRGVPFIDPVPFFGNMLAIFKFDTSVADFFNEIYTIGKKNGCIGMWVFNQPAIVLCSPELIKKILIKDFSMFNDRSLHSDIEKDPMGCSNLFSIKNPHWKNMRIKLSPLFSTSKLRNMFTLIGKVGDDMNEYMDKRVRGGNGRIEVKEVSAKFTTDVIASIAFGVEGNSFVEEEALFESLGRKMFEFTLLRGIELTSIFFAPNVAKMMRFKLFTEQCSKTFRKVFWDVINAREMNPVDRNDLINTLMKLKKTQVQDDLKFDGDILVAQAVAFFSAGFEVTSTAISYTLYEISKNKMVQDRLHHDIVEGLKRHKGVINYESINDMPYLEMCIKETLRKYPGLPFLNRATKAKYLLPNTEMEIDPDTFVYVPVYGLHMDPEFYPEPEKYDPERFNLKNINNRDPYTYIPFGDGPRNCIGARIAMVKLKVCLINLIKNYEVNKSADTPDKIPLDPKAIMIRPLIGIYLDFTSRRPRVPNGY